EVTAAVTDNSRASTPPRRGRCDPPARRNDCADSPRRAPTPVTQRASATSAHTRCATRAARSCLRQSALQRYGGPLPIRRWCASARRVSTLTSEPTGGTGLAADHLHGGHRGLPASHQKPPIFQTDNYHLPSWREPETMLNEA